jgi:hypothetical protein
LLPRYRETLKEIRDQQRQVDDAYTSDLDIDLTTDQEFNISELKINFQVLVPTDHKYFKQMKLIFSNI